MVEKKLKVLIVEDRDDDAELLLLHLHRIGYLVEHERVETAGEMRTALTGQTWDLIISDFSLPEFSAPEALEVAKAINKDLPFIIVSGTLGEEAAVSALKGGADDFIVKGRLARLGAAIERARRQAALRRELNETEERLRQSQKLEAIGRLAGGIAHDFNNLLSVVLSYSHLLLEGKGPDSPGFEETDEIRRAGESARDLTRQLLAFSRRQVRSMQAVNLNEVVAGLSKMLTRVLGEDIELVTLLARDLAKVRADPGQLEQVVVNLVVNARDAMPDGGTLTVWTSNVVVDQAQEPVQVSWRPDAASGDYVRLVLTDTGIGMDKETQERIFEPFFTTKEPGKGTGLGLSTVFGIVQQCGGHINVRSAPGTGAVFEIFFPRYDGEDTNVRAPVETSTALGGDECILVVEDDEQLRKVACTILRRAGYQVLEADQGREGLKAFTHRERRIHLVLTDVVMPTMSGSELAERVVAMDAEVKVIFMSGYPDETITRHGVLDGKASFLQKPLTPQTLRRHVRQVLDAKQGEIA